MPFGRIRRVQCEKHKHPGGGKGRRRSGKRGGRRRGEYDRVATVVPNNPRKMEELGGKWKHKLPAAKKRGKSIITVCNNNKLIFSVIII